MVVDVEGSSGRSDVEKVRLRDDLYGALMVAFARAGIAWDACRREDRGDGVYFLLPAAIPKTTLAGPLVAALDGVLAELNPAGAWPRLQE